jgi:hypothetical protein
MLMQLDALRETDNVEKEEGLEARGCSRVRVGILLGSASMGQMLRTLALNLSGSSESRLVFLIYVLRAP